MFACEVGANLMVGIFVEVVREVDTLLLTVH